VAASPHYLESILPGFLRDYAARFPEVQVRLMDTIGPISIGMLERGEIHLAQGTTRLVGPAHPHIDNIALRPVEMLAASEEKLQLGKDGIVDIEALARYPLLQTGPEYIIRQTFDAACRLAGFEPDNALESRAPHALLAMAEAGHGIAIIPSALRTDRYRLRVARIAYRRKVLSEPLAILFDKRRTLPGYAMEFARMLAAHVQANSPVHDEGRGRARRRNRAK
jgi:DNA-binding transcriptional LysR family regulator